MTKKEILDILSFIFNILYLAMPDDLDTRLLGQSTLAGPAQESLASRAWRRLRRGGESEAAGTGEEAQSLRQAVVASRLSRLKEQAKEKIKEKIAAPVKQGTSWLLKAAWLNLIDSFGLTLIYINLHVFLRWVLSDKLFCKLGEEWLPKQITLVAGEAGELAKKPVGLAEAALLFLLDLIALFIILGALGLIVMIIDFWEADWVDKTFYFIGGLTKLGWSGIVALYNLF